MAKAIQPVADFTQNVTSGQTSLSMNFTDLSTGQPNFRLWNFGDGTAELIDFARFAQDWPQ